MDEHPLSGEMETPIGCFQYYTLYKSGYPSHKSGYPCGIKKDNKQWEYVQPTSYHQLNTYKLKYLKLMVPVC